MDELEILADFTEYDGLPRKALQAAAAERARYAPRFIELIEQYLALPPAARPAETPFFLIFHLLGEWREKAAYRPLARFLRLPDGVLYPILSDAITETSRRVMLGVFDGDPQPLFDSVLDDKADEFARSAMCGTLAALVLRGELDQKPVAMFLRDCFTTLQPQSTNFVWFGWMHAIAHLGLTDYSAIVETAFKRQWIDPGVCGMEHFLDDLAKAQTADGRAQWLASDECQPFGNTIEELSRWHGFSDEYSKSQQRIREAQAERILQSQRQARDWSQENRDRARLDRLWSGQRTQEPIRSTKIGRNMPCPCRSGKKYKKCCAVAAAV